MCKPACAVWGLPKEEVCPDCLMELVPMARARSPILEIEQYRCVAHALRLAIKTCPPFRFLRLELAKMMQDDITPPEQIVNWVRWQRECYPPASYANGEACAFTLDPSFVEVEGRG